MTTSTEIPQNIQALKIGDAIRLEGAQIKRDIRKGKADPVSVVKTCTLPIRVIDLLLAIPRCGAQQAYETLKLLDLTSRDALGGEYRDSRRPITDRQREQLAAVIDQHFIDGKWRFGRGMAA